MRFHLNQNTTWYALFEAHNILTKFVLQCKWLQYLSKPQNIVDHEIYKKAQNFISNKKTKLKYSPYMVT